MEASESRARWPYVRSIIATLVPMRRASSNVDTPAARASVAKVWRSAYGPRWASPAASRAGYHSRVLHLSRPRWPPVGGLSGCLAYELAVAGAELELGQLLLGGLAAGVGDLGQERVDGVAGHRRAPFNSCLTRQQRTKETGGLRRLDSVAAMDVVLKDTAAAAGEVPAVEEE
jgi:hypothetical protein